MEDGEYFDDSGSVVSTEWENDNGPSPSAVDRLKKDIAQLIKILHQMGCYASYQKH